MKRLRLLGCADDFTKGVFHKLIRIKMRRMADLLKFCEIIRPMHGKNIIRTAYEKGLKGLIN